MFHINSNEIQFYSFNHYVTVASTRLILYFCLLYGLITSAIKLAISGGAIYRQGRT